MTELKRYAVWDRTTRWFHWINVLCVLTLIGIGLVILQGSALGIGNDGKIVLKTLHVYVGYVFALNLAWRVVWGFVGGRHARWRAVLPFGPAYVKALRAHLAASRAGRPLHYLGHNPIGRISVAVLLVLLLTQAVTGLVLAGTDLFFPPIGGWIAQWVAAPGVDPSTLVPYAKELYDPTAWDAMRAFRKPYATLHVYSFYALCVMVVLHIAAVVVAELREGSGLVSAMFSGRKVLAEKPADDDPAGR